MKKFVQSVLATTCMVSVAAFAFDTTHCYKESDVKDCGSAGCSFSETIACSTGYVLSGSNCSGVRATGGWELINAPCKHYSGCGWAPCSLNLPGGVRPGCSSPPNPDQCCECFTLEEAESSSQTGIYVPIDPADCNCAPPPSED